MLGHFVLDTVVSLADRFYCMLNMVKEPVMKGHLSYRDILSWILRCPYMTDRFTVQVPQPFSHETETLLFQ